jgi:hypothetical protein
MLGVLVDNIYVVFGDQVFQQSVGIPMGTNCAPLFADLFLHSYEAEFRTSRPSTTHLDISVMSCQSKTMIFTIMSTRNIPMNSK